MNQSLSLIQFQRKFSSDEVCLEAIEKMRWPNGFVCRSCGNSDGRRVSKRRALECHNCGCQNSITAGTIFEKTRVPLVNWFIIMFLVAHDKGGASALRISKMLSMRYDTVWHILHKIRSAMAQHDQASMLAGLIEIDEGFFGGRDKGKKAATAV